MVSLYSYNLRAKAIKAVKSGEKKINICRMLRISRNTLDLWLKREQKTGNYRAIADYQKGEKTKIKNLQSFREFVLQHNNKTQQQITQLWGNNLTQQNVSNAMKKLDTTRKKTRCGQVLCGYQERDEEKRKQFLQRINQIDRN